MEAQTRPPHPYLTTTVYYLAFICLGTATAVLGPTLQGLARNTGSTLAQISSLFLLSSFGYLIGSFFSGRAYDRVKGHPILSLSLLVIAGMMALVPLMEALPFLQAIFFVIGAAEGVLDVGVNTLIVWVHGARVPPFMNGLHAFYGIGTTTAPLIVAAVLSKMGSLNSVYWALTGLMLPVIVLCLVPASPSHAQSRQQAEARPAIPALVLLLTVTFFAFTGAELGFGGWIYTFTTSQAYATNTLAASVNAAFWAALTAGRLVSIPFAVKLKPQKILWVSFCGIILFQLSIILFSSKETMLWLGAIGTGLFMGPIFPTLLNDAQSRMHMSGQVASIFFAGGSLGSMALPWLMGQLIGPYGATSVIIATLCSSLVASVTFYALNRKHRAALASQAQL